MAESVLVSVCCFSFNHSKFIKAALDGFINQETIFNFEVIVHDDASTDGTQETLLDYKNRYPEKFKLILQEENQFSKGVSPFFDHVLPITKGKYIAICDGDDYWTSPYKLERQVALMEQNPGATICHHNTEVLYPSMTFSLKHKLAVKSPMIFEECVEKNPFATLTTVFRAECIRDIPAPTKMIRYADRALWLLLLSKGNALYMDEIWSVYRHHSQGIYSGASAIEKLSHRIDAFDYALLWILKEDQRVIVKKMILRLHVQRVIYLLLSFSGPHVVLDAIRRLHEVRMRTDISNLDFVTLVAIDLASVFSDRAKLFFSKVSGFLRPSGLHEYRQ